jgi:hypothetical protein
MLATRGCPNRPTPPRVLGGETGGQPVEPYNIEMRTIWQFGDQYIYIDNGEPASEADLAIWKAKHAHLKADKERAAKEEAKARAKRPKKQFIDLDDPCWDE